MRKGWASAGLVVASVLALTACAPEPRPLSLEVEWPDGEPEWMGDDRVRVVWERNLLSAASWNSGNFTDPRASELLGNSLLGSRARARAAEVYVGDDVLYSRPVSMTVLSIEGSDENWVIRTCDSSGEYFRLEDGVVTVETWPARVIETRLKASGDGYEYLGSGAEEECSAEGASIPQFANPPQKSDLGSLEYDEIVGPGGKNVEVDPLWDASAQRVSQEFEGCRPARGLVHGVSVPCAGDGHEHDLVDVVAVRQRLQPPSSLRRGADDPALTH